MPVDPLALRFDRRDVIFISFQRYCRLAGLALRELTVGGTFTDGMTAREIRRGVNLILYNAAADPRRLRFTLLHELGHVRLGHTRHGEREENEADWFASQMLAPDALLRALRGRGYALTPEFLCAAFHISKRAAAVKLRGFSAAPRKEDGRLLRQFEEDLNLNFGWRLNRRELDILCDEAR